MRNGECYRFGGDYKPIMPTAAQLQRMSALGLQSPNGAVTVKDESEYRKCLAALANEAGA